MPAESEWTVLDHEVIAWTLERAGSLDGIVDELSAPRAIVEPEVGALAARSANAAQVLRLREAVERLEGGATADAEQARARMRDLLASNARHLASMRPSTRPLGSGSSRTRGSRQAARFEPPQLLSAADEKSSFGLDRSPAEHGGPRAPGGDARSGDDEMIRDSGQMDVGVFIPIGNNGWIISATSPQYKPTFALNAAVVQKAEHYGLDFALSMIKLHGYGGATEYWDYNLESFTLMAGLAAVTSRIKLMASVAVLTLPPALVARMAVTIDSIAPGRFGVNIVSGWQKAEYDQMGLWPGDDYFGHRYDYSSEFVAVMRELWDTGASNFRGRFFTMKDCRLLPHPTAPITIVSAGQSERGLRFVSDHCDYSFVATNGVNNPRAIAPTVERLRAATAGAPRRIGALVLIMVIADETDEAATARLDRYDAGADREALAWMGSQSGMDTKASADSMAALLAKADRNARASYLQTLCGSYATVAAALDEVAAIEGVAGIMLAFDDFVAGMEQFGRSIQPLMRSRAHVPLASAA